MYTLTQEVSCTYEIKKSKFITHVIPYADFETRLAELKKQHPKARHYVTATRSLNEFDQIQESFSDDGEPKNTAGKPMLAVLQGGELIEVGAVCIRYFGGIKLGTGGLVRAYGDSLNEALLAANLQRYEKIYSMNFVCEYNEVRLVDYELKKLKIEQVEKRFEQKVHYKVEAPKELLDLLASSVDCVSKIPHR